MLIIHLLKVETTVCINNVLAVRLCSFREIFKLLLFQKGQSKSRYYYCSKKYIHYLLNENIKNNKINIDFNVFNTIKYVQNTPL